MLSISATASLSLGNLGSKWKNKDKFEADSDQWDDVQSVWLAWLKCCFSSSGLLTPVKSHFFTPTPPQFHAVCFYFHFLSFLRPALANDVCLYTWQSTENKKATLWRSDHSFPGRLLRARALLCLTHSPESHTLRSAEK